MHSTFLWLGRKSRFSLAVMFLAALLAAFFFASARPPAALAAPVKSSVLPSANHRLNFFRPAQNSGAQWGEITIAQPKVWQYERVNALLDGLLRDVEGVSLADLTRLDPNQQNAAAVRFVQSALGISVTYDQAAQVNASNTLQTFQAKHDSEVRQLNEYNNYMQGLTAQRDSLTQQIFSNNRQIVSLQSQQDQGTLSADQANQLKAATDRGTTLNAQLKDVNSMISGAGAPPTLSAPPTVTGTSATAPALPSQPALGDLLKSLPESVQKSIANALQSPTYPATKQLDSFITLLHERLAREISVMQDDLMRDPDTFAYLVQFDVGLYPSQKSKNHMARVEFDLIDCSECKVYSLYPGQSSYNVANYQGSSKRRSFAGNILTLIGLGISANYQRQEDTLKGSLIQSVYTSGFQDDTETSLSTAANQRFGWYYSAAPFDELITPGIRSTFAIVTVPRRILRYAEKNRLGPAQDFPLTFSVHGAWPSRDKPNEYDRPLPRRIKVALPATKDLIELPASVTEDSQRLHILRMEYNSVTLTRASPAATEINPSAASAPPTPSPTPTPSPAYSSGNGCKKDECATVLLTLDVPIDPNLVVTVHGTPLHRVRDWRGRATSVLPPVQSLSDIVPPPTGAPTPKSETVVSRSLLETDQLEPNSWFAVNSHDLLLTISHDLAGEEIFPVIQISDPGKRTLVIPNDLRQNFTEIIFDGFRLLPATDEAFGRYLKANFSRGLSDNAAAAPDAAPFQGGPYPYSTFVPLFQSNVVGQEFYAIVGQTGKDLILGFKQSSTESRAAIAGNSFLEARTSVILEDADLDLAWSLQCRNQGEELVCALPLHSIQSGYKQLLNICRQNSCPSISDLLASLRSSPDSIELSASAFVPNLQVWLAQLDPEGKNSFWSPGPTKIGMFPLGNAFVQDRKFKTWRFDPFRTTSSNYSIEACNYFGENVTNARVQYLTPLDYPEDLVPGEQTPTDRTQNCGSILLPTFSLQYPEIVLQTRASSVIDAPRWTDAIPISRLRPRFGRAVVTPIYDLTITGAKPRKIAGWDIKIPVNRLHCNDSLDFPTDFSRQLQQAVVAARRQLGRYLGRERQGFEWLSGATAFASPPEPDPDNGRCPDAWWQDQSAGAIQLHFIVPKQFIGMVPGEVPVIRTAHDVRIAVAKLPNLRKLLLPTKLQVESVGESQFALRGTNAGAIEAVVVQNGDSTKKFPAGPGADLVLINAVTVKFEVVKEEKPKEAKTKDDKSEAKNDKTQAKDDKSKDKSNQNTGGGGAAGGDGAQPHPSGSGNSKTAIKIKATPIPLAPGTYTLTPLIYDGRNYLPIEVTNEQGKALTYTVSAKKDAAAEKKPPEPDETVTITKTTKPKPTPTPTPTPTPPKQP